MRIASYHKSHELHTRHSDQFTFIRTPNAPMFRLRSFLFVFFLFPSILAAQESIGVAIDNHTPVNGMLLNPSAIVDQKPWLDVHLVGFGVHAYNNLIFLTKTTYPRIRETSQIDYNLDRKRTWAQVNADVLGPSASLSLGKHAVGLHTSVRFAANVSRLPNVVALIYSNAETDEIEGDSTLLTVKRARAKTLAWGEVGLSYGRILYQFDRHFLTGGVTLNRLLGIQANTFFLREAVVTNDSLSGLEVTGRGKYAYAAPGFTAGGGWSTSIGITYKHMVDDISRYKPHAVNIKCLTLPYRYKIMVALTDVGGIRMKRDALYKKFSDSDDQDQYLNSVGGTGLTDVSDIPKDGERYIATTPAALTTQFDYNFGWGVFLNGLWVQRLSLPSFYGPERANVLAVTPRYERKWFAAMLPVSLVNYRSPHVGFAMRLATVTIGTENVLPFFIRSNIYAADIYFHLRIRFYKGLGCRTREYKGEEGFRFLDKFKRSEKSTDACPKW